MKKVLVLVAAIALGALGLSWFCTWAISYFWAKDAVAASAARPWPGGMGPRDAVAARFPPQQANAASVKLTALANALPKNDAVSEFVRREIARGELAIGAPPALPDIAAIRALLLREPIVWERREGIGADEMSSTTRALQLTVARALVAGALAKARANDPAAWEDLHAVWKLARSLDG